VTDQASTEDLGATAVATLITSRLRDEIEKHSGFYMPNPPNEAFERKISDREIEILRQHMGRWADGLDDDALKCLIVDQWWAARQEAELEQRGYVRLAPDILALAQQMAEAGRITPVAFISHAVVLLANSLKRERGAAPQDE
jgi:hypothetical protein